MPPKEIKFKINGQDFTVNLKSGTVKSANSEWKIWESVFSEIAMSDGENAVSAKELGSIYSLANYLEDLELEKEDDLYNLFMNSLAKQGGNLLQFVNNLFIHKINNPELKPYIAGNIEINNENALQGIQTPVPEDIQLQGHYNRLANKEFYDNDGRLISSTTSYIRLNREECTYRIETTRQNLGGNNITTSYVINKAEIEEYIINNCYAERNNKRHYADIEQIRNTPEAERSPEQIDLLNEFDNLVTSIIETGCEYGVDPRLITAIIKQETGFDGNQVGDSGKGLMQITSPPIDYMVRACKGSFGDTMKQYLCTDFVDLCKSRGLDLTNLKSETDIKKAVNQIISWLTNVKKTKDYDFNIKLGTIILRYNLDRANGNVNVAARNYNGSALKYKYSENITRFYNTLCGDEKATYTIK